jgi:uncharacterized protein (TIGR00255 family)
MYSMTGIGREAKDQGEHSLEVEIKSVNHRFKDIRVKGPSIFLSKEIEIRNLLKEQFARGSFDIYLNLNTKTSEDTEFPLDRDKVDVFLRKVKAISHAHSLDLKIDPSVFLRPEFSDTNSRELPDNLSELLFETINQAIGKLKESRKSEGDKLCVIFQNHMNQFSSIFSKIKENTGDFKKDVKERIEKNFKSLSTEISIDQPRFLQEVVYYLEKLEISEEINRIEAHLEKLSQVLTADKEKGREIEFILQELGRETNTIGAKSSTKEISDNVVQLKVELEKMREQAQNIE